MASPTFGDVWRRVRLHASSVPFALVRGWVQEAYEDLCERRPWVWSVAQTSLNPLAARSLTVTFTQGSLAITSAAGFVATDVGRQVRVGTFPLYTINAVADASNATLDQPYAATSGAQTAQIVSAYLTLPEDFGAFLLIIDPTVQRQIAWWFTQDQLANVDPVRISSGTLVRAAVPTTLSTAPSTVGRSRVELWPTQTSARQLPVWYRTRPATLTDVDTFRGVLAARASVLETGALARCAKWPGTPEVKNPYFNVQLAKQLSDDFDRECAKLELRDDDQAQQTWVALPYHQWPAWGLSGDSSALRASDATLADYFGMYR